MDIDRDLQFEILSKLKNCYPESAWINDFQKNFDEDITSQLFYLKEHRLICGNESNEISANKYLLNATITAKGLDFLADDGGLSSILNIVTVRLDQTQFKELLVKQIEESELPKEQQSMLKRIIQETKREGISKIATELVTYSFNHTPHLLNFLHKLLTTPAV